MSNLIDKNGFIEIRQQSYFYKIYGNDALIFNKYFGYKLIDGNSIMAGFPVKNSEVVFEKLNQLSMNYKVYSSNGQLVKEQVFDRNEYEVIYENYPLEKKEYSNANDGISFIKKSSLEIKKESISVLNKICENIDPFTGEVIEGISDETRNVLSVISKNIKIKMEEANKRKTENDNAGRKWESNEDEQLMLEYNQGKTYEEISKEHKRSIGSIRSRLLKLFWPTNNADDKSEEKANYDFSNANVDDEKRENWPKFGDATAYRKNKFWKR